jgi:hypothetical protein
VQEQHHHARLSGQVVAEKGGGAKVTLALEGEIVEDVIDVDQEAAGGDPCGEGGGSSARLNGGACNRRRDEVAARAHVTLT